MAVGVASQSAQGQAMTITAAKYRSAVEKAVPIIQYQTTNVTAAMTITVGTK